MGWEADDTVTRSEMGLINFMEATKEDPAHPTRRHALPTHSNASIRSAIFNIDEEAISAGQFHVYPTELGSHRVGSESCGNETTLDIRSNISSTIRYPSTTWAGVCDDSGAENTVIGRAQALAYTRHSSLPWALQPARVAFRFGDHLDPSMEIMAI